MERTRTTSDVEHAVADRISTFHAEQYGQGPERARAYYTPGELLVVLLFETFTQAERRLIAVGRAGHLQQGRREFQQLAADDFTSIVEQETGERVQAFVSNTDLSAGVSFEVFLLGPERTDMDSFEGAGTREHPEHDEEGGEVGPDHAG